jgi:hypothetical protein
LRHADDHRRSTAAAVRARIGQEVALALEPQSERRRDDGLADDRDAMQLVVESQRETQNQHRRADLHRVLRRDQVLRREALQHRGVGQR